MYPHYFQEPHNYVELFLIKLSPFFGQTSPRNASTLLPYL